MPTRNSTVSLTIDSLAIVLPCLTGSHTAACALFPRGSQVVQPVPNLRESGQPALVTNPRSKIAIDGKKSSEKALLIEQHFAENKAIVPL